MTRILMIGEAPDAIDYGDPETPPGFDEEKLGAAINRTIERLRERGWDSEHCALCHDADDEARLREALHQNWDCVVIGAGVRLPPHNLVLFERVVNAVAAGAPGVPIAFNTSPESTVDAVARWLE